MGISGWWRLSVHHDQGRLVRRSNARAAVRPPQDRLFSDVSRRRLLGSPYPTYPCVCPRDGRHTIRLVTMTERPQHLTLVFDGR